MLSTAPSLLYVAVLIGALLAWQFRMLSVSGAVSAALLGLVVTALGGVYWLLTVVFFFLPSSLLSFIGRSRKRRAADPGEKSDRRDAIQVLANGGVGIFVVLVYGITKDPALYWVFVASFAAAAADTWGTELGSLARGKPRLLLSGLEVETGTSGGVSFPGVIASICGSITVVVPSAIVSPAYPSVEFMIAIALAGVIGALLDSIAGETVQGRYFDPETNRTVEVSSIDGRPLQRCAGIVAVNNDVVNLICTSAGAFLGFVAQTLLL